MMLSARERDRWPREDMVIVYYDVSLKVEGKPLSSETFKSRFQCKGMSVLR